MGVRLLAMGPFTVAMCLPLAIASVFVIAGLWRGGIYLRVLRSARP